MMFSLDCITKLNGKKQKARPKEVNLNSRDAESEIRNASEDIRPFFFADLNFGQGVGCILTPTKEHILRIAWHLKRRRDTTKS